MSRDGSGTYSLPATLATSGAAASSTTANSIMNDIAQALTDSINKDGTKAFAAAQSMGGNRLTSVGTATALTDAAQLSQVQKGNVSRAVTVGGTADAITLNFNPTITSYTTGMRIRWVSAGANTIAGATVNIDTLGAITLKKNPASSALVAGDIGAAGTIVEAEYDGTNFIVLNPKVDLSSYATTAAVASTYAPLASPALTGNPTAPTPTAGDNDTSIATTAFVTNAVASAGVFTTLGSASVNGLSAYTISSLDLTKYTEVVVYINAVSTTGTGTGLQLSLNGVFVGSFTSNSTTGTVALYLDLALGIVKACVPINNAANFASTGTVVSVTQATTSISLSLSFGTFDAGSMTVYGVK